MGLTERRIGFAANVFDPDREFTGLTIADFLVGEYCRLENLQFWLAATDRQLGLVGNIQAVTLVAAKTHTVGGKSTCATTQDYQILFDDQRLIGIKPLVVVTWVDAVRVCQEVIACQD